MKRPLQKPDWEILQQLPLALEIDEAESDAVSPDEARLRSENARSHLEETGASNDWYARYQELRSAGWSWRVACYIAWASCPKKQREPKSQELLATKVLGLTSDRQIWKWRTKNPQIDETVAILQAAPLFEHRADILRALIDSATDPDYKHHQDRKIALEMMGDYVPRVQVEDERRHIDDLDQLTEDELRKLASSKPIQSASEDDDGNGN